MRKFKLTEKLDLRKSIEMRYHSNWSDLLVVYPDGFWRWETEYSYRHNHGNFFAYPFEQILMDKENLIHNKGKGKEYRGVWKDIVKYIEYQAKRYYEKIFKED